MKLIKNRLCRIILLIIFTFLFFCSSKEKHEDKVRLGYLDNDLHHLAAFVAIEKGFFRESGVDVEVAGVFKAGPEEMSAFGADALDIGYVGLAPATVAKSNGVADVKIVAQANCEGSSVVVGRDSAVTAVSGLKGKIIAIPGNGTVQDLLIHKLLDENRILDGVNIVVIKPPEMAPVLLKKEIDGFISWEPYPSKVENEGTGRVLINTGQIWENHPCCVLVVSKKLFMKSQKTIGGIVKAHIKATDYINSHPDEAAKIAEKYTGMNTDVIKSAMKRIKFVWLPDKKRAEDYISFLNKMGYIKEENSEKFLGEFIDESFCKR